MRYCSPLLFAILCLSVSPFAMSASTDFAVTPLKGSLPKAPRDTNDARKSTLCQDEVLVAYQSSEERKLAKAGWLPLSTQHEADDVLLVTATNALDGQCRPRAQTLFVFHAGKAVGSVAVLHAGTPKVTVAPGGVLKVSSTFAKEGDPRCCPTGYVTTSFNLTISGISER